MSNALFEVDCSARAVKPEFGADKQGRPKVSIEFEIVDGEYKGHRVPYSGQLDAKNIKYTKRDMMAVGWQGKDVRTFVDDVLKANKTVAISTRIAEWDKRDGSPVRQWTSVSRIGGGAAPLMPLANDKIADVNSWFAEAGELSESRSNGASAVDDADVPF